MSSKKRGSVAIIGAGPAGITAAIQLKCSGIAPLLFERDEPGGLLRNANLVENYPGFPEGISGKQLVQQFVTHIRRVGVEPRTENVLLLESGEYQFHIKTDKDKYEASSVIVASGTSPKKWELAASIPDKAFYHITETERVAGETVVVIGGGDAAFDYALNLAVRGNLVKIIHRGAQPNCLPLLIDRAQRERNIDYIANTVVEKAKKVAGGVILECTGERMSTIAADFVLIAIGRVPELRFLSEDLREDYESGKKRKGLYFVGDMRRGLYRQTAIATGDALLAAMKIHRSE